MFVACIAASWLATTGPHPDMWHTAGISYAANAPFDVLRQRWLYCTQQGAHMANVLEAEGSNSESWYLASVDGLVGHPTYRMAFTRSTTVLTLWHHSLFRKAVGNIS